MSNMLSFYTIITGIFKYSWDEIDMKFLDREWVSWKERINEGKYKEILNHLDKNYYDSYITNMFPEIRDTHAVKNKINPNLLYHYTSRSFINSPKSFTLSLPQKSYKGEIPFIDIFLFPNKIGLFSIKFNSTDADQMKIEDVSPFLKSIRQSDTEIQLEGTKTTLKSFVEVSILNGLTHKDKWNKYNPHFKSFTIIDLKDNNLDEESVDHLLYDLGNVSEPGSAAGKGPNAPSLSYYQYQMSENKISVFKNWSALCLFDTFTRISQNNPDTYKIWEYDYFNIYIHTIYMKSFMYLTNTELSDVTTATRHTADIKDKFVEFINDYYLSHISYKFLPNLLYDKLMHALEMRKEIEMMEKKIQRINESFQKRREVTLNIALTIIIFLSLFSVITDLSSWLEELGISHDWIYPYSSIIILISILGVLVLFLLYRKKQS